MTDEDIRKYNIQTAAQLTGLSTHTIRAWEKRYCAVTPERSDNGRRLYSTREIDRLILLAELTRIGTAISQIAALPDDELKKVYQSLQASKFPLPTVEIERSVDIERTRSALLSAASRYDVQEISQLLSDAKNAVQPGTFALDLLKPLVQEVEELFRKNVYQKGQLQALFAIAKFHSGNIIYSHIENTSKTSLRYIIAGIDQEYHSFRLLFAALLCCHHKKHFYYLNSNIPAESISEAVKATNSNVLLLTVPEDKAQEAVSFIDHIHDAFSGKLKIWIRGDFDGKVLSSSRWKNFSFFQSDEELHETLLNN